MTTTATLPLAQIITRSLAPLNLPADVLAERVAQLVGELSHAGYEKSAAEPLSAVIARTLDPRNTREGALSLVSRRAGKHAGTVTALPEFVVNHQLGRINPSGDLPDADGYVNPHEPADSFDDAEIVTSDSGVQDSARAWLWEGNIHRHPDRRLHRPMLDIDFPAALIPSSTPGHFHLYLDKPMPWEKYRDLLTALGKAGILEPGYVNVSRERKYTALRLPWVKKPAQGAELVAAGASEAFSA
ncbi:hypothetical protein [Arthrobacter sp. A2-55]|uniref:hypothetical protein n=1 Tax=Arthrobacter sp. A2-55 TaxID=2897337 RepID=UPI0021CD5F82|nr:hypothetical protein [Arthrobacter sp. A2-55]MCU6480516.1 hypothetical protein [Arthrobacter sp. A2-55]